MTILPLNLTDNLHSLSCVALSVSIHFLDYFLPPCHSTFFPWCCCNTPSRFFSPNSRAFLVSHPFNVEVPQFSIMDPFPFHSAVFFWIVSWTLWLSLPPIYGKFPNLCQIFFKPIFLTIYNIPLSGCSTKYLKLNISQTYLKDFSKPNSFHVLLFFFFQGMVLITT